MYETTKPIKFRPTQKIEDRIQTYKTEHPNATTTEAVIQLIEGATQSEPSPETTHETWRKIGCPALLVVPELGYCCANKAPKIVPIPQQHLAICKFCWERQQKLKTTATTKPVSNLYKKPEKIYCIRDTIWLDPLKWQSKCQRCLKEKPYVWGKCKQKQRLP